MPRRPSTHVDDPKAVGRRVREARLERGLRQSDLVFEGCSAGFLSRIEVGERIPSLQVLRGLAERLGVTADYLATGEEPGGQDDFLSAELAIRSGDAGAALEIYERKATDPNEAVRARGLLGLGRVALEGGDHQTAIQHLSAALSTGTLPSSDVRATREQLGRAYSLLSQFDEALAAFEANHREAQETQDTAALVRAAVYLANVHIDRGDPQAAEAALAGVLDVARASSDPVALSNLFWSQSRLHASQQRYDLAADYARMAHAALAATEHTVFAARALILCAQMENDRGNGGVALELLDEAEPTISSATNRYDAGLAQLERARSLALLGQRERAAAIALGAIPMFEDSHPTSAGRAYGIAARVFADLEQYEKALELYELAADTLPTANRHLAEMYTRIAEIYERLGRHDQAMTYFKRALEAHGTTTATSTRRAEA